MVAQSFETSVVPQWNGRTSPFAAATAVEQPMDLVKRKPTGKLDYQNEFVHNNVGRDVLKCNEQEIDVYNTKFHKLDGIQFQDEPRHQDEAQQPHPKQGACLEEAHQPHPEQGVCHRHQQDEGKRGRVQLQQLQKEECQLGELRLQQCHEDDCLHHDSESQQHSQGKFRQQQQYQQDNMLHGFNYRNREEKHQQQQPDQLTELQKQQSHDKEEISDVPLQDKLEVLQSQEVHKQSLLLQDKLQLQRQGRESKMIKLRMQDTGIKPQFKREEEDKESHIMQLQDKSRKGNVEEGQFQSRDEKKKSQKQYLQHHQYPQCKQDESQQLQHYQKGETLQSSSASTTQNEVAYHERENDIKSEVTHHEGENWVLMERSSENEGATTLLLLADGNRDSKICPEMQLLPKSNQQDFKPICHNISKTKLTCDSISKTKVTCDYVSMTSRMVVLSDDSQVKINPAPREVTQSSVDDDQDASDMCLSHSSVDDDRDASLIQSSVDDDRDASLIQSSVDDDRDGSLIIVDNEDSTFFAQNLHKTTNEEIIASSVTFSRNETKRNDVPNKFRDGEMESNVINQGPSLNVGERKQSNNTQRRNGNRTESQRKMEDGKNWLIMNLLAIGGSLSVIKLSDIADSYGNFCQENDQEPLATPVLARLIHSLFPEADKCRLGARGNQRIHYRNLKFKSDDVKITQEQQSTDLSRDVQSKDQLDRESERESGEKEQTTHDNQNVQCEVQKKEHAEQQVELDQAKIANEVFDESEADVDNYNKSQNQSKSQTPPLNKETQNIPLQDEENCKAAAKKLSEVLKWITSQSEGHKKALLRDFAHSASCQKAACVPVCMMFRRVRRHVVAAQHSCSVLRLYSMLLRHHVSSCTTSKCGLPACPALRATRPVKRSSEQQQHPIKRAAVAQVPGLPIKRAAVAQVPAGYRPSSIVLAPRSPGGSLPGSPVNSPPASPDGSPLQGSSNWSIPGGVQYIMVPVMMPVIENHA